MFSAPLIPPPPRPVKPHHDQLNSSGGAGVKVVSSPHIAHVMLLILLESLEVKVIYASKVSLSHSEQTAFSISPTFPVGVNMVITPPPSQLS